MKFLICLTGALFDKHYKGDLCYKAEARRSVCLFQFCISSHLFTMIIFLKNRKPESSKEELIIIYQSIVKRVPESNGDSTFLKTSNNMKLELQKGPKKNHICRFVSKNSPTLLDVRGKSILYT